MDVEVFVGNNQGIYYVTEYQAVGEDGRVVWFGGRRDAAFANVFWGRTTYDGALVDGISGDWWDVPYGRTTSRGTLAWVYDRTPDRSLRRVSATGGFGETYLARRTADPPRRLALPIPENAVPGVGLTGVWRTDWNEGLYYAKESGRTVVWFGAYPGGIAANVFKGSRDGNQVRGEWIDLGWGRARQRGDLTIESDAGEDVLTKISSSRSYGSSVWKRIR